MVDLSYSFVIDLYAYPLSIEKFGRRLLPIGHAHDGQPVKELIVLGVVVDNGDCACCQRLKHSEIGAAVAVWRDDEAMAQEGMH